MNDKGFHSITVSLFCTVIIGSAYVAALDGVALAGGSEDFGNKIQSQVSLRLQEVRNSGWAVPATGLSPMLPSVPGRKISAGPTGQEKKDELPWPIIVDKIYAQVDKDTSINGNLCTFLDYSSNNQSVSFRQIEGKAVDGIAHDINVRKINGGLQIFLARRNVPEHETKIYRLNSAGEQERYVYGKQGKVQVVTEPPFPDGFASEKDYWLDYFSMAATPK